MQGSEFTILSIKLQLLVDSDSVGGPREEVQMLHGQSKFRRLAVDGGRGVRVKREDDCRATEERGRGKEACTCALHAFTRGRAH